MAQASGTSNIAAFLPLILMFAIFYFIVIRPQSKQRRSHEKMLQNLKKGDKILTMTETKNKKLIALYNNYVNDDPEVPNFTGQVKPSEEMGYVSSVEDARKKLEDIFNGVNKS